MKKLILILIIIILAFTLYASNFKSTIKEKIDNINISARMKVFLIAMIPIFELRGSIPIGVYHYKLPIWETYLVSIVGNMVPIFFILLFFDLVTKLFYRVPILKKLLEKIFERTRKKSEVIRKYEELGLILFVAIPLPVTGAWTGSLAAYLFGLKFWKSILFIFIGVNIAAVVVSTLTALGILGAIIAFVALSIIIVHSFLKKRRKPGATV